MGIQSFIVENVLAVAFRHAANKTRQDGFPALTEELHEFLYEDDGLHHEKTVMTGTVTSINEQENYALIDQEIFLDLGMETLNERKIRLNDKITVQVHRFLENDAWRVGKIDSIQRETWDAPKESQLSSLVFEKDIPEGYRVKQVVGKVTSSNKGEVILNYGEFTFETCKVKLSFAPLVGDWLLVSVCFDPEDGSVKPCCLSAQPLRQWKVEGYIRSFDGNEGHVNDEIFFSVNSCLNGYVPRVNDSVHVTAIESGAGGSDFTWRAVHISKKVSLMKSLLQTDSENNRRKAAEEAAETYATTWVVKGQRPYKPALFVTPNLPVFAVPRYLWQSIRDSNDPVQLYPCLAEPLSPENYRKRFGVLLHLEEIEMTLRIREYSLQRAILEHKGEFLCLTVEGLAEKRPSLVPGDSVLLSPLGSRGPLYEGFIHETRKSEIFIKFAPDFHMKYSEEPCSVTFQFNRTPLRRCHLVTESASQQPGMNVLFPEQLAYQKPQVQLTQRRSVAERFSNPTSTGNEDSVRWFNGNLNKEQKNAVRRIILGEYRPVPYIIYGPPGTGKTVTVVEAILQIFRLCPHSRILVATPSNSSADLISERLHDSRILRVGDMVRLNAVHRNLDNVPDSILPYCSSSADLERVVRHRIVVTTCTTAGTFYTLGLRRGHFTHVFIDEAGQTTEPECLVPIGLLQCSSEIPGQIVLAGDPQQLGPVLQSKFSTSYGLSLSLLERLSLYNLYRRDEEKHADFGFYNPGLLTKLVRNYRSHPALLKLPSSMFYDGELVPCATRDVAEKLAHLPWLPVQGIPLAFHGVRGTNFQEADSPSWCNPSEVYHVVRYLQKLLNSKITTDEIGIITPYRKQVEKIRKFISASDLIPVKVGSVEEFQGQERDAIIVSTVRSSESMVSKDILHNLGFVRSPKRFNVTVTRAKALLVIVGNPFLLIHDEYWGPLLRYCVELGVYTGCEFSLGEAKIAA